MENAIVLLKNAPISPRHRAKLTSIENKNLGRRFKDDQRQINRWKRIVSRFKGILIRMIKKGKGSPKIRQILLHCGYELKDKG